MASAHAHETLITFQRPIGADLTTWAPRRTQARGRSLAIARAYAWPVSALRSSRYSDPCSASTRIERGTAKAMSLLFDAPALYSTWQGCSTSALQYLVGWPAAAPWVIDTRKKGPSRSQVEGVKGGVSATDIPWHAACSGFRAGATHVLWLPGQSATSPGSLCPLVFPVTWTYSVKANEGNHARLVYFFLCCSSKNWHLQGIGTPQRDPRHF